MKRTVCLVFSLLLSFAGPVLAQERTGAAQEKIVRETYRKLELYNAAAQIFDNEPFQRALRPEANLAFELTDFRSGDVPEIVGRRYAELVTLPTGEIVSLTPGSHSMDQGPEESMFVASWARGQYAPVFDPQWTVGDVFNFEPARYYDIASYTSYQVTVPSFGVWGYALARRREFQPPVHVPKLPLRFLNDEALVAMFDFPVDMKPVPVEVNQLDNQALVRYYEREWRKWE